MIDLFVQVTDFQLGFQVYLIIMLRAQPIFSLLTVLAHHNNRSLNRRQAGKNQVQQYVRIWIRRPAVQYQRIKTDPEHQKPAKADKKRPTAAERGDVIRQALAQAPLMLELGVDIFRERLVLVQAVQNFLLQRGYFALLGLEQRMNIF